MIEGVTRADIIQELAKKYGVSPAQAEQAVSHQYKVVARIMADGSFRSVRLPYWGIYEPLKNCMPSDE